MTNSIKSDLGINGFYQPGQTVPIRNCWHFYTDGSAVVYFFSSKESFIFGMNQVYFLSKKYSVTILAFVLMETHVHFVLYGNIEDCTLFMQRFVRAVSIYHLKHEGEHKLLKECKISHQIVENDLYLKTVISYVLRNPTVARIPFTPMDYPWGSGSLYFRNKETWAAPGYATKEFEPVSARVHLKAFSTKKPIPKGTLMIENMIHPQEYVAVNLVEMIFKSAKGFFYFLSKAKEDEVEAKGGVLSSLTIPLKEMRDNKKRVCKELFGVEDVRRLTTNQRLLLARRLKSQYNCSIKQISRISGLVYDEVKDLF